MTPLNIGDFGDLYPPQFGDVGDLHTLSLSILVILVISTVISVYRVNELLVLIHIEKPHHNVTSIC